MATLTSQPANSINLCFCILIKSTAVDDSGAMFYYKIRKVTISYRKLTHAKFLVQILDIHQFQNIIVVKN